MTKAKLKKVVLGIARNSIELLCAKASKRFALRFEELRRGSRETIDPFEPFAGFAGLARDSTTTGLAGDLQVFELMRS